jgi:hypothetical protein
MRYVLVAEWGEAEVIEYLCGRELLALAGRVLTERERAALLNYLDAPRKRMPASVRKAIEKLRAAYR